MAIIECPHCAQRISDLHPACPNCKTALPSAQTSEHGLLSKLGGKLSLEIQGYVAILLMIVAGLWYYRATDGLAHPPEHNGSIYLMAIGAVWYLSLRTWMIISRFSRR